MSVWGFGGLSTLKADAKVGDNKNGMGGSFGIGYKLCFYQSVGIDTGLKLSFYNAK